MDKDISRLALEGAASALMRVRKTVQDAMPYGPAKVRLTPSELRKKLQNSSPDAIQRLMQYLGPEQAVQMLMGIRKSSRTPPTLEQFMEEQNGSNQ